MLEWLIIGVVIIVVVLLYFRRGGIELIEEAPSMRSLAGCGRRFIRKLRRAIGGC